MTDSSTIPVLYPVILNFVYWENRDDCWFSIPKDEVGCAVSALNLPNVSSTVIHRFYKEIEEKKGREVFNFIKGMFGNFVCGSWMKDCSPNYKAFGFIYQPRCFFLKLSKMVFSVIILSQIIIFISALFLPSLCSHKDFFFNFFFGVTGVLFILHFPISTCVSRAQ